MERVEELFLLNRMAVEEVTRAEEMTREEETNNSERKNVPGEDGRREVERRESHRRLHAQGADKSDNSIDEERSPEETRAQ
jgi:hypothetical protein